MNLRIADFKIKINSVTDKRTIDCFSKYCCDNFGQADLTINYIDDDHILLNRNEFTGPYKGWFFKQNTNGYEFAKFADGVDRAISHVNYNSKTKTADFRNWNISNLIGVELFYSVFYTISDIYSFFVLENDSVVFHSSSIIYDNHALCFSGKSGTGKSTHTGLWKKYYNTPILNDDSPTLRIIEGKAYACGTPFAGSTGVNLNNIVPLKAIFFLEQSKENSTERLTEASAIKRFFDETKKPIFKSYITTLMEFFTKLYEIVPMYVLSCNMEKSAVETVKNTLNLR